MADAPRARPVHALTAGLLVWFLAWYAAGAARLWRRAGRWRGITRSNVACFSLGWLAVGIALLSPLHHYSERYLWAHMVQHELLMVVAAPLLILARSREALVWGSPERWRRFIRIPQVLLEPTPAWTLHAAAIWLWHIPGVFEAAVSNEALHIAQHASFFVTAVLFWWTALAAGAPLLAALVSLFTTMLHTGALGALMALAGSPWYVGYGIEDQQLAGFVMWVPAGLAYPVAALFLMQRLLRRA